MRRILEQVYGRPWFSDVGTFKSVDQVVQRKLNNPESRLNILDAVVSRKEFSELDKNGIATIDIYGVTGKRLSSIEKSCGACDYNDLEAEIGLALEAGAKAILFTVDSGGGAAIGCAEVANLIASLSIPTVAFVDNVCASAAYYMASGADYIVCTNSALIGSIGVIAPWVDESMMYSLIGLKFDPITNEGADLKSTGHGPSLTPGQREYLQGQVNDLAREFKEFVAAHRPANLNSEVWRAGAYHGSRAVALGLADQIGTTHDAYTNLQLAIQMKDEMNTPQVDTQPTEHRSGYVRVGDSKQLKSMEELEKQTTVSAPNGMLEISAKSQTEDTDIKSVLTQLSADIKSMTSPVAPIAALEAKVEALTAELAKVKEYSEAVNQRYIALEASRGTPTGVKVDHRGGLDRNAADRQRVNETIAAIKTQRNIPN
jgi:ClpP class serine protease